MNDKIVNLIVCNSSTSAINNLSYNYKNKILGDNI
jgi:hypothetical protein